MFFNRLEYFGYNNPTTAYLINQRRQAEVNLLLENCQRVVDEIPEGRNKVFAQSLMRYLEVRSKTEFFFSDTLSVVKERTEYVNKVATALKTDNLDNLKDLLAEDRIKPFKGYFSQIFYDLLSTFRKEVLNIDPPEPSYWFCRPW
jgi:hypothetical protein